MKIFTIKPKHNNINIALWIIVFRFLSLMLHGKTQGSFYTDRIQGHSDTLLHAQAQPTLAELWNKVDPGMTVS